VQIAPASGTGTSIGLPPGEKTEVNYDGTNVDFVGLGRVGSFIDMAVSTTQPWMRACTTLPYLPCDGAINTSSLFPALGAMLGSTFGGNGVTTFGIPDFRNRFALPVDLSGQGRVTNATSGVDGTLLGATGGSQSMQAHTHLDNGHIHSGTFTVGGLPMIIGNAQTQLANGGSAQVLNLQSGTTANIATPTGTAVLATAGVGASQNMPPVIVFGCRFIKT
jgi:microcystin-dependent protein